MKNKLFLNYIISGLSFSATVLAIIYTNWFTSVLCGIIFIYLVVTAILRTRDYLEHKRTERAYFEYFLANKDKILKEFEDREFEYIYGVDKK